MRNIKDFLKMSTLIARAMIALLIASVVLFPLMTGKAQAIDLKQNSVVDSSTIKLGDIFYGLKKDEEKVLGAAPRPGQEMVLSARTLLRVALAMNLDWRPSSTSDYVTVRRAASVIKRDTIENALQDKLAQQSLNGSYKVIVPSSYQDIILPPDQPEQLEVTSFEINADNSGFRAEIAAPSAENPIQSVEIAGSLDKLVTVPVLKDTLRNGSIIGLRDIDLLELPERKVGRNTILLPEEVIGTTPRHMVSANQPIKSIDVEQPRIIERGEIVTMIFKNGTLTLTTKGKALQHGAKGDVIRVVNTGSSKTIEALVTADKEVTVQTF